jgi:hypothetical protein
VADVTEHREIRSWLQLLPWPSGLDLIRRRQVRGASWRIGRSVTTDGELDGPDLARLALVRLLWLQRQTHRAVRTGNREAAIVLARTAMETAIAGLYCISVPEAATRYKAATGGSIKTLMADLISGLELLSPFELGESLTAAFGKGREPTVTEMSKQIADNDGPDTADGFNRLFYQPVSNMYVHAGAGSLSRHADPRTNRVRRTPMRLWTSRSAANVADFAVALLAVELVQPGSGEAALFREYATAHASRVRRPHAYLLRSIISDLSLHKFVQLAAILRRAHRTSAVDEAAVDALFAEVVEVFDGVDPQFIRVITDRAKERLIAGRVVTGPTPAV